MGKIAIFCDAKNTKGKTPLKLNEHNINLILYVEREFNVEREIGKVWEKKETALRSMLSGKLEKIVSLTEHEDGFWKIRSDRYIFNNEGHYHFYHGILNEAELRELVKYCDDNSIEYQDRLYDYGIKFPFEND